MDLNELRCGDIIQHFKRETDSDGLNYLYMYIGTSVHTETGEKLVIYSALYGRRQIYTRPVEIFCSKVDKEKYPNIKQEYRFKKVNMKHAVKIGDEYKELNNAEMVQGILNRNELGESIVNLRKFNLDEIREVIIVDEPESVCVKDTIFAPTITSPAKCPSCKEKYEVYVKNNKLYGIELVFVKESPRKFLYKGHLIRTYKCHSCGNFFEK